MAEFYEQGFRSPMPPTFCAGEANRTALRADGSRRQSSHSAATDLLEFRHYFSSVCHHRIISAGPVFMSFEPFGYRFEITTAMPLSDAKVVIRLRKRGWFDAKNGARGWICGPLICLWFSAFDRYGPMLFGMISDNGTGSRITGRAGSDLNGVLMFSFWIPVMGFITYKLISGGQASLLQFLVIAAIVLIGGPLVYWLAHKDRREAEPLVRFLHDALNAPDRKMRKKSAAATFSKQLSLSVAGEKLSGVVREDAIHDALVEVGPGNFVILEEGPEIYVQTAFRGGCYIIEKRDGNGSEHYRALRTISAPDLPLHSDSDLFDFEEVREVFMAYASEQPFPHFLIWERMNLGDEK